MLTRDPFRHLDPPRKPHPAVTGAAELITSLAVIAAVALVLFAVSRPPAHTGDTGRMVARVATRAVAGFTPSRPPLSHGMRSQASRGRYGPVRGTSRVHDEAGR